MKKNIKNNFKGFSFIEVMVSVFLLSVGMVAVISLISSNLSESMDSRDQVIAGLLAQEGVELMRNYRDTCSLDVQACNSACLDGTGNNPFCSSNLGPGNDSDMYVVDLVGWKKENPSSDETSLFYQPIASLGGESFYAATGDGANETRFKRLVELMSSDTSDEVEISVIATWGGGDPSSLLSSGDCDIIHKCVLIQNLLIKPME